MPQPRLHGTYRRLSTIPSLSLALALALPLALTGCVQTSEPPPSELSPVDRTAEVSTTTESLPVVAAEELVDTWVQLLPEPTPEGDNVAIHVRLPPPLDPTLEDSLVRVFDGPGSMMMVRTDALVQLGLLAESPGPDVFTAFASLPIEQLEQRLATEQSFAAHEDPTEITIEFSGRTPVAVTTGLAFDLTSFLTGSTVSLGPCPFTPASTPARWEESLMIIDPAVVQDPTRTHDHCAPGGNPNGVWTFKHLMNEMAQGSGMSTHDFVIEWLSSWLNDVTLNGDLMRARPKMFSEVIEPWANASGVQATLVQVGGVNGLDLNGPLDLDLAPFRLSAIVNRIDLETSQSHYGGSTSTSPAEAGELRFIFGVQNLDTCQTMQFSVIFEYGVPVSGCDEVQQWALDWTALNDGVALPRFSAAWLAHLEGLTQSVVVSGAAPGRGNDSALNQIRTNDFAITSPLSPNWELREFTLSVEDLSSSDAVPPGTPDMPMNGPLQLHTVAMTPDDDTFNPLSQLPAINDFISNEVVPTVIGTGVPGDCATAYVVPAQHPSLGNTPLRGGSSETIPPESWHANLGPSPTPVDVCGRHQFSLNTCNGCHGEDTFTPFFHVDPTTMPATLSAFLSTGPQGIFSVPDSQFGTPMWDFADLDRRFHRLYEIACDGCAALQPLTPDGLSSIAALAGVVPLDTHGVTETPWPVGPINDLGVVEQLLTMRGELSSPEELSVALDGLARPVQTFVH